MVFFLNLQLHCNITVLNSTDYFYPLMETGFLEMLGIIYKLKILFSQFSNLFQIYVVMNWTRLIYN
jgi:hypothetical protein